MLALASEPSLAFDARMENTEFPSGSALLSASGSGSISISVKKCRQKAQAEGSLLAVRAKLNAKGQSSIQQEQAVRAVRLLLTGASSNPAPAQKSSGKTGETGHPSPSGRVQEETVPDQSRKSWEEVRKPPCRDEDPQLFRQDSGGLPALDEKISGLRAQQVSQQGGCGRCERVSNPSGCRTRRSRVNSELGFQCAVLRIPARSAARIRRTERRGPGKTAALCAGSSIQKEVDLVLEELDPPYRLVTSLLYGFRIMRQSWKWEYGRYDSRGQLMD